MNHFTQSMVLLRRIVEVDPTSRSFKLRCRSGDTISIYVGPETAYGVVSNLDGLNYDRVPMPPDFDASRPIEENLRKYVRNNEMISVVGVYQEHEGQVRLDARAITLMHSETGRYLFETTHWWLTQISLLADEWLDGSMISSVTAAPMSRETSRRATGPT